MIQSFFKNKIPDKGIKIAIRPKYEYENPSLNINAGWTINNHPQNENAAAVKINSISFIFEEFLNFTVDE